MKILVIHQYYLMPGQPGGSRFNELSRLWTEAGHQVCVVAGTVNYATGEVPERYRGKWVVRENDNGVDVRRAHVAESYGKSYAGRMWAFGSFTASATTAAALAPRADVVIATSPPLITPIPGWLAAKKNRAPFIFEIRDLWPESAITTGVLEAEAPLTRALYGLEKWACRIADRINVLTPAFKEDLIRRGLAPAEKIVFVPNGADLDSFRPASRDNDVRRRLGWGNRFVVMYAGAHGRANAVDQLVHAAEHLIDREDILIALVGDGPERPKVEEMIRARGLRNIMVCGPQPKSDMPAFVNAADCGAAVLQNNPTFRTVYPNKVFDYMACERPTLLAIDGVARKLVCDDARAGIFAEPENPASLASAIRRLADSPELCRELGANGRRWVIENASRDALAKRYLDIMEDLVRHQ